MRLITIWTLAAGLASLLGAAPAAAQRTPAAVSVNHFYQYGIGPAFMGGLYREGLPVRALRQHGSFGIAAPAQVDGELIELNGRVYQTKASGETRLAPDTLQVPFGMVCFFKPDTSFVLNRAVSQAELEQLLAGYLRQKNGLYAVRISGEFTSIRTRALHRVAQAPFPPVAALLPGQQVFDYAAQAGTVFGYRLPAFMSSLNSPGYHFHFLAARADKGGHVLDFVAARAVVEVALLRQVEVTVPTTASFSNYQFK